MAKGAIEKPGAKAAIRKPVAADFDKAKEWLDTHWKNGKVCPVCGDKRWGISDEVLEMRQYSGGRIAGGPIYPYLSVMCLTCGNTLFFNALHAGLIEQPDAGLMEQSE